MGPVNTPHEQAHPLLPTPGNRRTPNQAHCRDMHARTPHPPTHPCQRLRNSTCNSYAPSNLQACHAALRQGVSG
jgi:hypothetical protein